MEITEHTTRDEFEAAIHALRWAQYRYNRRKGMTHDGLVKAMELNQETAERFEVMYESDY